MKPYQVFPSIPHTTATPFSLCCCKLMILFPLIKETFHTELLNIYYIELWVDKYTITFSPIWIHIQFLEMTKLNLF